MSKLNKNASEKMHKDSVFEKAQKLLVTCMLFEDRTYMDGESCTKLLSEYASQLSEKESRELLHMAKDNKLRHAPAFWAIKMLKNGNLKPEDIVTVCDRVDIMSDLLSLYWSDKTNKHSLPKSLTKGLQKSFGKFDEYQFSKYKAKGKEIKLKDVLRLVHPIPQNDEQSSLYKRILDETLKTPDTWEVALTKCHTLEEKKDEWTRLLTEKTDKGFNKLGALALIRNLRNMTEAGVDEDKIRKALKESSMKKLLPFQIVRAAEIAENYSDILQDKLLESLKDYEKLDGDTLVLVDVSGSMYSAISGRSDIMMVKAAGTVAAIISEACDNSKIYTFDTNLCSIPSAYKGFPLIEEIVSKYGGCTAVIDCTNKAIEDYKSSHQGKFPKRVIVLTDEGENSSCGRKLLNLPKSSHGYMVNVASNDNSVEYSNSGNWTSISGWSEALVKYITAVEKLK